MMALRHVGRLAQSIALYTLRSGRWWVPAVAAVWALAAVLVITAKTVVPAAVYTLF